MSNFENLKVNKSISRNGFIGFIIMALFTFIMEFVLSGDSIISIPPWVKYLIYMLGTGMLLILGVDKPEMRKFLSAVQSALADGKLSGDEAIALIRSAWFMIMGFWADQTQVNEAKKKIDEIKLSEIKEIRKELKILKEKKLETVN